MTITRFSLAFISLLPCLALAAPANLQDASQLFRQGRHAQALDRVNSFLATHPRDAQGRFLKGLVLTELNRPVEAIKVFSELTDDYPELPEPYNNLAVLYAAQGQYERAKNSLEMAIRTHPSYATAHENLGDIYAKMASLSYDKALQLDQSNRSALTKLSLIKDLFAPTVKTGTEPTRTAARPAAPAKPTASMSATPSPVKPEIFPAATAAAPEPPAPPAATPPAATAEQARVEAVVRAWAAAWSNKDADAYLGHYGNAFEPPQGMDRAAWENQRRERITRPAHIQVQLNDLRIRVDGDQATARFRQLYSSDRFRDLSNKTLTLVRQGESWKIVREQ